MDLLAGAPRSSVLRICIFGLQCTTPRLELRLRSVVAPEINPVQSDQITNNACIVMQPNARQGKKMQCEEALTDFCLNIVKFLFDVCQVFVRDRGFLKRSGHGCGCEGELLGHVVNSERVDGTVGRSWNEQSLGCYQIVGLGMSLLRAGWLRWMSLSLYCRPCNLPCVNCDCPEIEIDVAEEGYCVIASRSLGRRRKTSEELMTLICCERELKQGRRSN